MAEILTFNQIKTRHKGKWVLVGDPVVDESLTVQKGHVLFASASRDDVYCKAREVKPKRSAILFFGRLPKNTAIVL